MVQNIARWWLVRIETCRCNSVIKCCVWLKFVYSLVLTNYLLALWSNTPWDANSALYSRKIPRILRNPKVHYRLHNPPPVQIQSQINPVPALASHFSKINFNVILPSTPISSKWSFPFTFPLQNAVCASSLPNSCHMHRPSHSYWPDNPITRNLTLPIMPFPTAPVTSSLLRRTYLLQYPVLVHPQSMFFPECERPSFTPIQNNTTHTSLTSVKSVTNVAWIYTDGHRSESYTKEV